ncbi:hypothetical protein [Chroococcidiopsis sp [FACHB-1243]]|uniref:hypothetical protein n=1 Tax=Chroococcidiopsis sp. [FACHB-1243] TaxID=2692781 RepID=UPI00177D45A1|nr:hypothetical protein [Chroococcidiopsis sp. [FACHB-1243]]
MQPAIHFADSPQIARTSIPSKHKRFEYMTSVRAGLENRSIATTGNFWSKPAPTIPAF